MSFVGGAVVPSLGGLKRRPEGADVVMMNGRRLLVVAALAASAVAGAPAGGPAIAAPDTPDPDHPFSDPIWSPLRNPARVSCVKTNCHGPYHGYDAIDLVGAHGDPIYAAGAGVLHIGGVAPGCSSGEATRGTWVWIDHGPAGSTRYHHLDSIVAADGQFVTPGTQIATMGHSGDKAPCQVNYLHMEFRSSGDVGTRLPIPNFLACSSGQTLQLPQAFGYPTWDDVVPQRHHTPNTDNSCLPADWSRTPDRPSSVSLRPGAGSMTVRLPTRPGGIDDARVRLQLFHPSVGEFGAVTEQAVSPTQATVIFDDLLPNRKYRAFVSFHNSVGWSAWSNPVAATTGFVPARPAFRDSDSSETTIGYKWHRGSNADADYTVAIRRASGSTWGPWSYTEVPSTDLHYRFRDLHAGTRYQVTVRAHNEFGASPWASYHNTSTLGAPASANLQLVSRQRNEIGPLGAITVIGDSVLIGSVDPSSGATLDDRLVARGWGPVRVRARIGMSAGAFDHSGDSEASYWIRQWRSHGWDPPTVMVNIGAHDSASCRGDTACAYAAIVHLVDAIGPQRRVWWPKITRHPLFDHEQIAWNTALDRLAAERDNVVTWNWPSIMIAEGQYESDRTHLTRPGYLRRSELMALEATADLARASKTKGAAALPAPSGPASEVVPVGPVRVLDTRTDAPGRVMGGTSIEVDVSAHIPAGSTAVAVYVTATGTGDQGYLTAYECSAGRPTASSANYRRGDTRGAVTITPVSSDGRFCLFSRADADVVVDLQAAFVGVGSGGSKFTPLAAPRRLVDTRNTGRRRMIEVAIPGGADVSMAAVSITAINGATRGYLVAYPCTGRVPTIATVNHGPGEVIAGAAFVPVSPDGTVCVYAKADVDVTVDLTGTFSATGDLVFRPVPPTRTIDTRSAIGGWSPVHGQAQTIDARVAPAHAEAVSGTVTIVRPMRRGHLRAWGCGPLPPTANVTAGAHNVLANALTTGVDDGRLCVFARSATSTVFDTTGWWIRMP